MKLARDQLLAGAVLAEDEDVGVGRPGPLDQRPDPRHCRRLAEQRRVAAARGRRDRLDLLALGHHLGARGAKRGGGSDGGEQPLVRPGLGDEVGGAALHRLDRDADPGMGGDHHHHRLRIALQYLAEPVEALGGVGGAAAEIGVEEDDVGKLALHRRERLGRVLEGGDLGEQVAQQESRRQSDVGIVVDDDAAPEALR